MCEDIGQHSVLTILLLPGFAVGVVWLHALASGGGKRWLRTVHDRPLRLAARRGLRKSHDLVAKQGQTLCKIQPPW